MHNFFDLTPPYVAPEAVTWGYSSLIPRVPSLEEMEHVCNPIITQSSTKIPDQAGIEVELDELETLAGKRDKPLPKGVISSFLQIRPQPLGARINTTRQDCSGGANLDVILTGRELARWFELETPGLGHRHALNYLLKPGGKYASKLSPLHQARIWAALDIGIYASLIAAWHYKWQSPLTPRRARPSQLRPSLTVLYDYLPNTEDGVGQGDLDTRKPSPGTPRHPAYPAGHSITGGVASALLSYFFPDEATELNKIGENSGMARLWAGIHYRSDHTAGIAMGKAIAELIIERLKNDGA